MAAGISHEINTPLNVITTKTDLIRRLAARDLLDKDKLARSASEIDDMVRNISSVIAGLKGLTRMEPDQHKAHRLTDLVSEAVRLSGFRLQRAGVQLHLDLPQEVVVLQCYPVQIIQILVNLLQNAVDAIAELRERWIRIEARQQGAEVRLRVIDSGRGIDPTIAEKVMTPFFTTKRDQHGTGLGLSLSRSIAQRHGGDLRLVPDVENTCFEVALPLNGTQGGSREQHADSAR